MAAALATASVSGGSGLTKSETGRQPGSHAGARRGRPRKFDRPSRAVTLTLPVDTLATLRTIDADLSRAVVRALEPVVASQHRAPAELATFGNQTVILVPPSAQLRERVGVDFVPLSGGRALITFDEHLAISDLELRLADELAEGTVEAGDRAVFEAIAAILRTARRDAGASLNRRSIIILNRAAEEETT